MYKDLINLDTRQENMKIIYKIVVPISLLLALSKPFQSDANSITPDIQIRYEYMPADVDVEDFSKKGNRGWFMRKENEVEVFYHIDDQGRVTKQNKSPSESKLDEYNSLPKAKLSANFEDSQNIKSITILLMNEKGEGFPLTFNKDIKEISVPAGKYKFKEATCIDKDGNNKSVEYEIDKKDINLEANKDEKINVKIIKLNNIEELNIEDVLYDPKDDSEYKKEEVKERDSDSQAEKIEDDTLSRDKKFKIASLACTLILGSAIAFFIYKKVKKKGGYDE